MTQIIALCHNSAAHGCRIYHRRMTETLFGLPIRLRSRWIFNCYMVGDPDTGITLVDPGLPSVAADALSCIATEFGADASPSTMLCTHAHPDHLGGMPHVLSRHQPTVLLPSRCESYLAGEQPRGFGFDNAVRFLPVLSGQKFNFATMREFASTGRKIGFGGPKNLTLPFSPDGFLDPSAVPASLDGWEVIEAPGHTDDSTCLYHAPSATLISGDAVVTLDGRAWFNPEWVDTSLAAESEEKLRSLEVRHLLPGHGLPIESPDVWRTAMSFRDRPQGKGILARCSRRFGRWNY